MAGLEIQALSKHYRDGARALDGVELEVGPGELMVLVGPSGSGKTTLLRLVAGLDEPTAGTIRLSGKDLSGMPPHRRNVALVFQNLALYSHLTVADNLRFGLTDNPGEPRNASDDRVRSTAERLGIGQLLDRLPGELSGGEQQRVALGRAIVRQPAALLLDEPLSSLDGPLRRSLRRELKALQRSLGVPTIYVTHDQAEALALGDRIAVLDRGKLRQVGTPNEVYHQPANRFVAEFFGSHGMNLIAGDWKDGDGSRRRALYGFRPDDIQIDDRGDLQGQIDSIENLGGSAYAHVRLESRQSPATSEPATSEPATSEPATSEPATSEPATSEPATSAVIVRISNDVQLKPGDCLRLRVRPERVHWFDVQSGERLIERPDREAHASRSLD